jgi:hypothetical protein
MSKFTEIRLNIATTAGTWHAKATRAYLKEGITVVPDRFLLEIDPEIKVGETQDGKPTRNYRLYGDHTFMFVECSYFDAASPALIEWNSKTVVWCRLATGLADAEIALADRCPA